MFLLGARVGRVLGLWCLEGLGFKDLGFGVKGLGSRG